MPGVTTTRTRAYYGRAPGIPWERPPNVKFVDLGGGGLAELVGLKLGEQLNLPLRNATVLLRSNPKPSPTP